jgi:hypothetical protein
MPVAPLAPGWPGVTSGSSRVSNWPAGASGTSVDTSVTPLSLAGPLTSIGRKMTASARRTMAPMMRFLKAVSIVVGDGVR